MNENQSDKENFQPEFVTDNMSFTTKYNVMRRCHIRVGLQQDFTEYFLCNQIFFPA